MTVANNTNKVREDGNGSKTAFTFSFEVFDEAELEVYKVVKATGVATLQTITTDYTVALNASSPGGTVTYVTAPSALQESFIKRVVPLTQETDIPNVGGIREEQIENQLDRGVMIDQQLQEQIDRCPKLPDASTLSDLELPAPEASKYIGWNADADELENKAAPTNVDYLGNIAFGDDASKAASPAQGDIYFATDTGKLYLCLSGGAWTWYNPTTMTTRGDIEYYGASGKARLGVGTSGYLLSTQGAGADPVWTAPFSPTAANALTGSVVQFVSSQTGTYATGTTAIPSDDTIPQNTEGTEFMTLAVTPTNANNKLIIDVCFIGGLNGSEVMYAALFKDSVAGALATGHFHSAANEGGTITFRHVMVAGAATAMTFKVRAGGQGATCYFNGLNGAAKMGGVQASSISILEVKV